MKTTVRTLTLDNKIDALSPGGVVEISRTSTDQFCTAARSGDGARLTFVRHSKNTSTVFKRCNF